MLRVLLVGLGGGLGAMARYGVGLAAAQWAGASAFPYGTLAVNVLGCLAIGMLAQLAQTQAWLTPEARLLLVTGFLGGFTTFSAFGNETVALARGGAGGLAVGNVAANLGLGLGAVWVGQALAQRLWP